MSSALGDRASTKFLAAEQLGSENDPVDVAYITTIVPPPPGTFDPDPITLDPANGRIGVNQPLPLVDCDIKGNLRSDMHVERIITPIPNVHCSGDVIYLRNPTPAGMWVLPDGREGQHFWLVNNSGNGQRIQPPIGSRLNTITAPNFITIIAGQFVSKFICGADREWFCQF